MPFDVRGTGGGEEDTTERPDIVVVMVDDLGAIDERVLKRLPEFARCVLEGGLRFDSAYSETPLCCPGRASFLTGQHTRNHGVVVNDARSLDPSYTVATALNDAGYCTIMAGKYLNGADGRADDTSPGWDRVAMLGRWDGNVWSDWWIDGVPQSAGHNDRFVADKARELLSGAPADQPLFAWITPRAPHEAEATGNEWLPDVEPRYSSDDRCDGIEPWSPPSYDFARRPDGFPLDDICRSLLTVDDMVGELRDEAAASGPQPDLGVHVRQRHGLGRRRLRDEERSSGRPPAALLRRSRGPRWLDVGTHLEHRHRADAGRPRRRAHVTRRRQELRGCARRWARRPKLRCSRTTPSAVRPAKAQAAHGGASALATGTWSNGTALTCTTSMPIRGRCTMSSMSISMWPSTWPAGGTGR